MASDQFHAEVEWLLRVRRERNSILRLIRDARRVIIEGLSVQMEEGIRGWASEEAARIHDNLERVSSVLDSTMGRYLEGPVIRRETDVPALPAVKVVEIVNGKAVDPRDHRPVKGPGRRFRGHYHD